MKHSLVCRRFLPLFFLSLFLSASMYADQIWIGSSTPSVLDEDLFITGNVELDANVTIQALTQNVTVTLANNPVVRGEDNSASVLRIEAAVGRTVTFVIDGGDNDLTFLGSNGVSGQPLLILQGGLGTVIFQMTGNRVLNITSDPGIAQGTQYYVYMQDLDDDNNQPTLRFIRNNAVDTDANVNVYIGQQSVLSYVANNSLAMFPSSPSGLIAFDASCPGNGRMFCNLLDTSAFIVDPHYIDADFATSVLSNVLRNVPAGGVATIQIENSVDATTRAGTYIVNGNTQLFDLLVDPFCNLGARDDFPNFTGTYSGIRFGFVLGGHGVLQVNDNAFLDYVGITNNACPAVGDVDGCEGVNSNRLIKHRNPSAFFVDGYLGLGGARAEIRIGETAAVYFRSGVDVEGNVNNDQGNLYQFTIDPTLETPNEGEIVFDVEGRLDVFGENDGDDMHSKMEILSLHVTLVDGGARLFPGGTETIFPRRTFDTNDDVLYQYNKGAWLINNRVDLTDVSLSHTDVIHDVFIKDDIKTEPTYIGGENFTMPCRANEQRPSLWFRDARLLLSSDAAFAGVDLRIPNRTEEGPCGPNIAKFIFYSNGRIVDNGTGRNLNLGAQKGSTACDGCTIISREAHLDVVQSRFCNAGFGDPAPIQLFYETGINDSQIDNSITTDITGQKSLQTTYLGHASNISVGLQNPTSDDPYAPAQFIINGNFFSFETRGGRQSVPALSNITGEGGIFVDHNGLFSINPHFRASMAMMVTKSQNGAINLPTNQVYFDDTVGIAEWLFDLSETQTIIPADMSISDYTFNWISAKKDLVNFAGYSVGDISACMSPVVTNTNLHNIPTIVGEVEQLQIQGSRIGDEAHILVDGGWVRELVFQRGNYSGGAAAGVVVIKNGGRVGIGTASRTVDSLDASVMFGVNGVTIIADGDGEVDLNQHLIVNNICAILKGPNLEPGAEVKFNADTVREIRIKDTGILDLRSFSEGDIVTFTGHVQVILEAGAQIWLAGATLRFESGAHLIAEPYEKSVDIFNAIPLGPIDNDLDPLVTTSASQPHNQFAPLVDFGNGVRNTDPFRVKLIGTGVLSFHENSCFFVPQHSFVGVETCFDTRGTVTCEIPTTDLTIAMNDSAIIWLGDKDSPGGSFQVGNTTDRAVAGHSISFAFSMQGDDTEFRTKSLGFFGMGVGIVSRAGSTPNEWYVDNLFNVNSISLIQNDGNIVHDRVFSGDSPNASLWAFGQADELYQFVPEDVATVAQAVANESNILGGGNIVRVAASIANAGALAPIVSDDDDAITVAAGVIHPRLRAGILASREMMEDDDLTNVTADALFTFMKVKDWQTETSTGRPLSRAVAATGAGEQGRESRAEMRIGYVDTTTPGDARIGRQTVADIDDANLGSPRERRDYAVGNGMISIQIDQPAGAVAPRSVLFTNQLP